MCPDPQDEQSGVDTSAYSQSPGVLWLEAPEDFQRILYQYWMAVQRFAVD